MKFKDNLTLQGILCFIIATCFLGMANVLIKKLALGLSPYEIMFFRTLCATIITGAISLILIKRVPFSPPSKINFMRSALEFIAMPIWVFALSSTHVSQVVALSFTTPIISAILASIFLHDKMAKKNMLAMLVGLVGVLIAIKPVEGEFSYSGFMVLAVCFAWAFGNVFIKKLTLLQNPLHIVLYTNLLICAFTLPVVFTSLHMPAPEVMGKILLLATLGLSGHYLIALAYSKTKITNLLPFDYSRLIFSSVFAFVVFGEVVSVHTLIGSIIIFSSACYLTLKTTKN
jgi:drug/metabolite transporter (DMT)-like permease